MALFEEKDKLVLLKYARSVIESELKKCVKPERPQANTPIFSENKGCFVTLHKKGELRGCIGTIEPVKSLIVAVEDNGVVLRQRDRLVVVIVGMDLNNITPLMELQVKAGVGAVVDLEKPYLLVIQHPVTT